MIRQKLFEKLINNTNNKDENNLKLREISREGIEKSFNYQIIY